MALLFYNQREDVFMNNELQLTTKTYRATFTGLEILGKSTKEEWEWYGQGLRMVEEAKQWAIGDWLCDGKKHYGDGLYEKASKILGWRRERLEISKVFQGLYNCHYVMTNSVITIIIQSCQ